MELSHLRINGG